MSERPEWKTRYVIWVMIATFPLFPLFEYLGKRASGPPAAFSLGMIVAAAWWRWDLSDQSWFWPLLILTATLHIPLVWYIPWTNTWVPASIRLPFCLADFYADLWILSLFEWLSRKSHQHS